MATKVLHFTRVLLGRIYIIIYIHIGLCELVILSFYILEHIFFGSDAGHFPNLDPPTKKNGIKLWASAFV